MREARYDLFQLGLTSERLVPRGKEMEFLRHNRQWDHDDLIVL